MIHGRGRGHDPHVVIAGGRVGALEGLLALQDLAGDRVHISVLTAGRHLTYRAPSVAEPLAADPRRDTTRGDRSQSPCPMDPGRCRGRPSRRARGRHARRSAGSLRRAPPRRRRAGRARAGGAVTFGGPSDVLALKETIEALARGGGTGSRSSPWPGPRGRSPCTSGVDDGRARAAARARPRDRADQPRVRSARHLRRRGQRGGARRLTGAGVHIRVGTFPTEYADGTLWLELEGPVDADLVVALPRLRGPELPGLPQAPGGFVPVGAYGRVSGVDRVWAVATDDPAAPAGRSRRPAGRRRRRGHRSAGRRLRHRGAAVPAYAPGHVVDGRRASVPGTRPARTRPLEGLVRASLGAGTEDRRRPPRRLPRVPCLDGHEPCSSA